MHNQSLKPWQHSHNFSYQNEKGEKNTRYVLALTAVTMVVEIVAGIAFGSVALFADGLHMATHVIAFMVTLFAYRYAKAHRDSLRFSFGTGKVGVLGGFASAVILAVVALVMAVESIMRLIEPRTIIFDYAIAVACVGLIINIICAFLLKDHHHHDHHTGHSHHHHHDHNLKAAYLHVLADALTSVLAIAALFSGKYLGWVWMDALMGVVGSCIVLHWAYGLVKETSPVLLDNSIKQDYINEVTKAVESDKDNRVTDIHIWKVSAHHYAAIISIATHHPESAEYYKILLESFTELSHISIEVFRCEGDRCLPESN